MENVHASRIDTAMFWAPRPGDPMGVGFRRLVTVVLQHVWWSQELGWEGWGKMGRMGVLWERGTAVMVGV